MIIGVERETRKRRRVAMNVANTASKAGSMVVVVVSVQETTRGGQPFVVSTGGRSCDVLEDERGRE